MLSESISELIKFNNDELNMSDVSSLLNQSSINKYIEFKLLNIFSANDKVREILSSSDDVAQFACVLISCIYSKIYSAKFNTAICFDASCNGLQHISAMFHDTDLATAANVLKGEKNEAMDLYSEVALYLSNLFIEMGNNLDHPIFSISKNKFNNSEKKELINKLFKILINRKFVKRAVMTVPYNASIIALKQQLLSDGIVSEGFEET